MAINQPGLIAPRQEQREEKRPEKTQIEKILEGLQIAGGILGAVNNVQQIRVGQGQIENQALQRRAAEQQEKDVAAGVLTKEQELAARKDFDTAAEGEQGSFILGKIRGEGGQLSPLVAKSKTPLQKVAGSYQKTTGPDGKPLLRWTPDGGPDLPAYVEPKAPKDQELITVETVDDNGNPVTKVVPKTAGAEFAKPKKPVSEDERFSRLSKPDQISVTKLTEDATKKTLATTQIDNQLANLRKAWQSGNTDLAVQQGQEMLKILNSDVGADAVGVEESKRLGNFLEYKIANFRNPGSFIGRDVDQFYEAAAQKNNSMKETIAASKKLVDDILSGKAAVPVEMTDTKLGPQGGNGTAQAAPGSSSATPPGTIVRVGGKEYRVGADGDTLEPLGGP